LICCYDKNEAGLKFSFLKKFQNNESIYYFFSIFIFKINEYKPKPVK